MAYGEASNDSLEAAEKFGWNVVRMATDWNRIFARPLEKKAMPYPNPSVSATVPPAAAVPVAETTPQPVAPVTTRWEQEIAAIETGYRIGRILVTREVLRQAPAGFSAATKCFCTEHETRVAEFVAATLGAEATLWDDVTRGLVYAPGYTIMGGTSNIMRNILGERVLGLPREPR